MESGIEPSVDLETLDERIKIREMILKGQIQEAIALINSLHPELLDTNRYLYFHLQVSCLWTLDELRFFMLAIPNFRSTDRYLLSGQRQYYIRNKGHNRHNMLE